jgi:hypothetical protein
MYVPGFSLGKLKAPSESVVSLERAPSTSIRAWATGSSESREITDPKSPLRRAVTSTPASVVTRDSSVTSTSTIPRATCTVRSLGRYPTNVTRITREPGVTPRKLNRPSRSVRVCRLGPAGSSATSACSTGRPVSFRIMPRSVPALSCAVAVEERTTSASPTTCNLTVISPSGRGCYTCDYSKVRRSLRTDTLRSGALPGGHQLELIGAARRCGRILSRKAGVTESAGAIRNRRQHPFE